MSTRIHILGASGSGTTTLGRPLAQRLGCPHFDTDDYFWLPTDPPFQQRRERSERQSRLGADLSPHRHWVLSGSLCGWGDVFIPSFDLVVFLWVPTAVRLARLAERERARYGADAVAAGGRLHARYTGFMAWAAAYDDGGLEMRSRRLHEEWLRALPCPVLRFADDRPTEVQLEQVMRALPSPMP
ncbi:MAG TPA: AAA family ATPase [Methylomirabilota bacterium]|jgi:adenylate kinase family enzyme|nr:AAA family ATPase [Methylomirabilota bacterium]